MTNETGHVVFSDLMFSVYGKAGIYKIQFICEGVSVFTDKITVQSSINKLEFSTNPVQLIKEELVPLEKALMPII